MTCNLPLNRAPILRRAEAAGLVRVRWSTRRGRRPAKLACNYDIGSQITCHASYRFLVSWGRETLIEQQASVSYGDTRLCLRNKCVVVGTQAQQLRLKRDINHHGASSARAFALQLTMSILRS